MIGQITTRGSSRYDVVSKLNHLIAYLYLSVSIDLLASQTVEQYFKGDCCEIIIRLF